MSSRQFIQTPGLVVPILGYSSIVVYRISYTCIHSTWGGRLVQIHACFIHTIIKQQNVIQCVVSVGAIDLW